MATIKNRAPFEVHPRSKANSVHYKKFRGLTQAEEYKVELEACGIPSSIKQAETGSWDAIVRLVDGQGHQYSETRRFHTKEQAVAWATEQERIILAARDKKLSMSVNQTPWNEAVKTWFAVMVAGTDAEHWDNEEELDKAPGILAGKTVISYNMPRVIDDFGADTPIGEITTSVVRAWRDKMVKVEKYTASTIANFRQIISGTFKYYISEKDLIGSNPCKEIQWPKPRNVDTPPKLSNTRLVRAVNEPDNIDPEDFLDDGEREELARSDEELMFKTIQKQSPWLVPIVQIALATGMRRGEILDLHWEYVDFDDDEIHIIKEKNDHRKKPTEEKGRKIPVWPILRDILESIQPDKAKRTGPIFTGTKSSVSHSFAEAMKKLGWTDLSFHGLRKVATGRLAKILPNCIELAHITGHRDLQTLARRYYGVDLKDLAKKITSATTSSPQ